eukprot:CAMPEP_0168475756 /NCGR_PEP_ID=MMETSP0228-20121227/61527_1 /TAXON_ID=133427 /ORGANISM="Protoceratium reticulatum, Strain CCCM 535 (=CCMP 1889)" /LENGTH=43 /DNA_ID= /DNA_START= /DNA_END= /DNA_ORIENTATION=
MSPGPRAVAAPSPFAPLAARRGRFRCCFQGASSSPSALAASGS